MTTTTPTTAGELPAEFADLAPFSAWILDRQLERYTKRLASTMEEMQAFYNAVFPRVAAIVEYCNGFPIDDLPEPVHNLMRMMYSFIEVSFPVEVWRQPRVPDSGAAVIECTREPIV
jgi:hypothetical protein